MEQLQSMQITIEARLDKLLHHWNVENKLSFLQKKEVRLEVDKVKAFRTGRGLKTRKKQKNLMFRLVTLSLVRFLSTPLLRHTSL